MQLSGITTVIQLDETVIRNTPLLNTMLDDFDELIDDDFDRSFAYRFTQPAHDVSTEQVQHHAIDYIFTQLSLPPSRFSDGSFPAWYASQNSFTTFYETSHHWIHQILADVNITHHSLPIYQKRTLFSVTCNALLLDLREKTDQMPDLISTSDTCYPNTRAFGRMCYASGSPGLYTRSARHPTGDNIVVYDRKTLKDPALINNVLYEYHSSTKKIIIRDLKTEEVLLEM